MTSRRLAGWLLILMGVGLIANQASADSWRWIFGAAMALPFAVAGFAVLAGKRWGMWVGLGVAGVGLVIGGFVVVQANSGGGSEFTAVLDFFGADGCYSCWDVALGAIAFVLVSLVVVALLLVALMGGGRRRPPDPT